MLALAACAPSYEGQDAGADAPHTGAPRDAQGSPRDGRLPVPGQTAHRGAAARTVTAGELIGLDAKGLDRLLGRPELVRRDGSAEVRLYRGSDCTLHLFLYPRNGSPQARHIEARSRAGKLDANDQARCLHDVARTAASR